MANPNTKIIIQEYDATTPKGSGVSSDIAYIPGLAVNSYAVEGQADPKLTVKNTPVLCYSVSDFETAFGPKPYVFTPADIDGANAKSYATTLQAGGYDRSYIYAKELLNAGLPVYYENIAPGDTAVTNVIGITDITAADPSTQLDSEDLQILGGNSYKYVACQDRPNTESYNFAFSPYYASLPAPADLTNMADNSTAAGSIFIKVVPSAQTPTNLDVGFTLSNNIAEENKDKITYTGDSTNGWIVTWSNATKEMLQDVTFNIQASFTYKGKKHGVEYPFSIAIVAGTELKGEVVNGRISYLYDHLSDALKRLEDKNEYTIKYITSGGFPTYDIGESTLFASLLSCAGNRGDALALIDHLDRPDAPHGISAEGSIYKKAFDAKLMNTGNAEYGAMFTPWGKYAFATITDNSDAPAFMPASFGYLMCMASAINTSPNWLAMAGVTRGMVPNLQSLHTDTILSNVVAEDYQPKYGTNGNTLSINCITNIKPYGLCIWGNRTLQLMDEKGAVALNFLNTRNMVSDIKKLAYSTAKKLMFEQDSDTLWLRFKSGISPLLDQLVSGYGISGYKIIRSATKHNGQALTRGEMAAVIKIFPIAPIEYFEITVELADNDVQVG